MGCAVRLLRCPLTVDSALERGGGGGGGTCGILATEAGWGGGWCLFCGLHKRPNLSAVV